MAQLRSTRVDLPGLMEVLGKNLYSTPEVALRELVQNAHDSVTRRRFESEAEFKPVISVTTRIKEGQLVIEDSGAGLTDEEIVEYLATVGRGYTGKMRKETGATELIGAFGLGFLSAYFVSERVELYTTSYRQPEKGWYFASNGAERFQLEERPPRAVGTQVILHLNPTSADLCEVEHVRRILRHYCGLLPVTIEVDGDPINLSPPWRGRAENALMARNQRLEFARRFENRFNPLCTLELSGEPAQGLLWIQDGWSYGTSDRRNVSVYVRGMLVSPDARDLLPEWAGFLGGVVECEHLTPTASREDLQKDSTFHAVRRQLRDSLVAGLAALSREGGNTWQQILERHGEALIGAALCDTALFDLLAEQLRLPTSEGQLPLALVRQRCQGKIYVSLGEEGGYEEVLFRALKQPVVLGTRYGAYAFSKLYCENRGGRLIRLGTDEGNRTLFPEVELEEEHRAMLVELFSGEGRQPTCTRFQPVELPLVLVPDREAALKKRVEQRQQEGRLSKGLLTLVKLHTDEIDGGRVAHLYLNIDSPLIERLADLPAERRRAAADLLLSLGELMCSRNDEAVEVDATATLRRLSAAIESLF